ncbi:hypothetical protein BGW38_004749, partial [Lunasporangiospora selenospora]
YQSFRLGADAHSPTIRIEVEVDIETGLRVVFWEDIEFHFPGVRHVRHGNIAISFARDAKRARIEPLCIKYHPDVVLDVIIGTSEQSSNLPSSTLSSSPNDCLSPPFSPVPTAAHGLSILTRYNVSTVSFSSPTTPTVQALEHENDQGSPATETLDHSVSHLSITCPTDAMADQPQDSDPHGAAWKAPPVPPRPPPQTLTGPSFTCTHSDELPSDLLLTPTSTLSPAPAQQEAQLLSWQHEMDQEQPPQQLQEQTVPHWVKSSIQASTKLFHNFEQLLLTGQLRQAESIQQEIRSHFGILQQEMLKNQALSQQMIQLQTAAKKMQTRMLEMQQQTLDRLAVIQSRVQAVLTQTYELHEYPIPRLFIVLPVNGDGSMRDNFLAPFISKFRLYFLCECGEHTQSSSQHQRSSSNKIHHKQSASVGGGDFNGNNHGSGHGHTQSLGGMLSTRAPNASISHHIHLAKHEGYDLDRPSEFFQKYGGHILTLLQMLKYGVLVAGIVLPPLAQFRISESIERVQSGMRLVETALEPKVDYAIEYLSNLTSGKNSIDPQNNTPGSRGSIWMRKDESQTTSTTDVDTDPSQEPVHELEALEGADLRQLSSFLKTRDEGRVLGNLYRIVTREGHVKWFREVVGLNNGSFDETTGKVRIRLSSSMGARQFYDALEQAKFIQELMLMLDWDTSFEDLKTLRDTMLRSNVVSLKLDLCQKLGPSRDILNRSRRSDPILQMLGDTKLQSFSLEHCDGFWGRISKPSALSSFSSSVTPTISSSDASASPIGRFPNSGNAIYHLRTLSIVGQMENWKTEQYRLEEFLRQCPRLVQLHLQCTDIDATFELIKRATRNFLTLQTIYLSVLHNNTQEHADVFISQPSGEIESMVLATNRRPYFRLVHSGLVRRLTVYNTADPGVDEPLLKSIFEKNPNMEEFGARCSTRDLPNLYKLIYRLRQNHPSLEMFEIQDEKSRHRIIWKSVWDRQTGERREWVRLELFSFYSEGRAEILQTFGSHLRKFPPGAEIIPGMMAGLEEAIRLRGSVLENMYIDITSMQETCLSKLVDALNLSPNFKRLTVVVSSGPILVERPDRPDMLDRLQRSVSRGGGSVRKAPVQGQNLKAAARFIMKASRFITKLQICVHGLEQFLTDLALEASLATTAFVAAASMSHLQPSGSPPPTITVNTVTIGEATFPVVAPATPSMPLLEEFEICPASGEQGQQAPQCQPGYRPVQWLQIPLSSPRLRTVSIGYIDIQKDGWTMVLQSLKFDQALQSLSFEGTNLSDVQARLLVDRLSASAFNVTNMTTLGSSPPVGTSADRGSGALMLKQLTIKDSLVTKPTQQTLEAKVREAVPGCRVILS